MHSRFRPRTNLRQSLGSPALCENLLQSGNLIVVAFTDDRLAGETIDSKVQPSGKHARHNRLLVLIAIYKVLQALLFAMVGVGALHLLHKDVGDVLAQFAAALRFNPESRFVNLVLDEASFLNDPLLRRIGLVAFSYAGVSLAEGIGLYLEKAWAEYLTLVITASFLPWEIVEVFRKLTWIRVSLLIVNVLVFLYLLRLVTKHRRKMAEDTT